jgi:hypothetical protein
MNKQYLVPVAIFVAGAAVGFLVGKKVYESYYANLAQEEIDSVKTQFSRDRAAERAKSDNSTSEEDGLKRMGTALTRSSLDGTKTNQYDKAKRNYNLVQTSEIDDEEEDDEELTGGTDVDAAGQTEADMDDVYTERDLSDIDRTLPYLIDDREYSEEFDSHDKISLYYYRVDDVLCEESEAIIDDIDNTVGYDAISRLDAQTTCWVRNEPLGIDYEIVAINKSFAETVYGLGISPNMSPREKYAQKQRRREYGENE